MARRRGLGGSVGGERRRHECVFDRLEAKELLATIGVWNTNDSGPGSLREAILTANLDGGPDVINFRIPASVDQDLGVPVSGFDPVTQTWRIRLQSPLPPIEDQLTLDGLSQAHSPVPYRYPGAFRKEWQDVVDLGLSTGGTFTLTTTLPLATTTTTPLAFDSTAVDVRQALEVLFGVGNVQVTGAQYGGWQIQWVGDYLGQDLPQLIATSSLTGGVVSNLLVSTLSDGGVELDPTLITSQASKVPAIDGFNAELRLILDGYDIDRNTHSDPIGVRVRDTHSIVRGLVIEGFHTGIRVELVDPVNGSNPDERPEPDAVGVLIQANAIGGTFYYPVDPEAGLRRDGAGQIFFASGWRSGSFVAPFGNEGPGIVLEASNATVGGHSAEYSNIIVNNGAQGIHITTTGVGNQVIGNQIGVAGPALGRYLVSGNGAEGILVEGPSNVIGGARSLPNNVLDQAGNVISGNGSHGIHLLGEGVTQTRIEGNFIGLPPAGGYALGAGDPGNEGDGIRVAGAKDTRIGGPQVFQGNAISGNNGAGVRLTYFDIATRAGASARSRLVNNVIGLTADGGAPIGNDFDGVLIETAFNTVGAGNIISANLRGVRVSGPDARYILIEDSYIGTDITGLADLGNAREGVRVENGASDVVIRGTAAGKQLISGNDVGILITQSAGLEPRLPYYEFNPQASSTPTTRVVATGNHIGADPAGTLGIGNSRHGVLILNAPGNTIGGSATGAGNLILANHWGVVLQGSFTTENVVAGNVIADSETHGVRVFQGAHDNMIGGMSAAAGNVIRGSTEDGVRVESGVQNAILSNSISQNGGLGIDLGGDGPTANDVGDLDGKANNYQNYPILTKSMASLASTAIDGRLESRPNTSYTVQIFTDEGSDLFGFSEGAKLRSTVQVTTDAAGVASFMVEVPVALKRGAKVTATATSEGGDTSEFSMPIENDDRWEVSFSAGVYRFSESSGLATVTVVRSGATGAGSVRYTTQSGAAVPGRDFQSVQGVLTFAPGEVTKTFTVPIVPNQVNEGMRAFSVLLSQPDGVVLGSPSWAALVIDDDDAPGQFGFRAESYTAYEGATAVRLTVDRVGGSGGRVSVPFTTVEGVARAGEDFVPVSGVLVFEAGQVSKTLTITIADDSVVEQAEWFTVRLGAPSSGVIGSNGTAVVTIVDNEVDGEGPRVTGVSPVVSGTQVAGLRVTFSEPLEGGSAADVVNYTELVSAGRDGKFRTLDDVTTRWASAVYEAGSQSVLLRLQAPVALNTMHRLTFNRIIAPSGPGSGVADRAGNLLDGDGDGLPGGMFQSDVGFGTSLSFVDQDGDKASLSLKRGGLMGLWLDAHSRVVSVQLSGTVPGKSKLSGSVRKVKGSNGRVQIPRIVGLDGVSSSLRAPAFVVGVSAASVPVLSSGAGLTNNPSTRRWGRT